MSARSCSELGVCQSREPRCAGCRILFAPGAIEHWRRPPSRVRQAVRASALAIALSAAGGLLFGLARGKGWL